MSNKAVADAMDSLDDTDMVRVERLILKLAQQKKDKTVGKVSVSPKHLDKPAPRSNIPKRKNTRNQTQDAPQHKAKAKKKKYHASREAIDLDTPRVNKFLDMRESDMHHNDTHEFDKKVNTSRPTPRMSRTTTIEVECNDCGDVYDVSPDVVRTDPDTRETVYLCNDCEMSRAKSKKRGGRTR